MRKAVRELIRQRQQHSKYVVEQVDVKQVAVGVENRCFQNAIRTAENDTTHNIKIVSGWLVGEYDEKANGTALIQHYWNYDVKGKYYFDITPTSKSEQIHKYVVDTELMTYSQQPHIYDVIDDCIGHSLWYSNGKFSLVTKPFLTQIPLGESATLETSLFFMDFGGVDKINKALKQMEVA